MPDYVTNTHFECFPTKIKLVGEYIDAFEVQNTDLTLKILQLDPLRHISPSETHCIAQFYFIVLAGDFSLQ